MTPVTRYMEQTNAVLLSLSSRQTTYITVAPQEGWRSGRQTLWNWSMERGFRYTTMVYDGDSKSSKHLTNLRVYGDVELRKKECISHVTKQLGTALRKLVASGKKGGITLGGRGFGRLTETTMGKLEEFYYLAVRGNTCNLNKMYDAVWASFYHASSTDEKPQRPLSAGS